MQTAFKERETLFRHTQYLGPPLPVGVQSLERVIRILGIGVGVALHPVLELGWALVVHQVTAHHLASL